MKRSLGSRRHVARLGSKSGARSSNGKKLALAVDVKCDSRGIHVRLDDARELSAPLLPFLKEALPAERRHCRIGGWGTEIYWPDLDEVVGVDYVLGVPEDDLLDYAGFKTYRI